MAGVIRSVRLLSFWGMSIAAFVVVATYPLSLSMAHPARFSDWLRNDLAFSVFGLWVLPLLFGLVVSSIVPSIYRALEGRDRKMFLIAAIALIVCGLVVAVTDLDRKMQLNSDEAIPALAEPVMFAAADPVALDAASRRVLRAGLAALIAAPTPEARAAWETQRLAVIRAYGAAFPGFAGFRDFWARGNAVAKSKFGINVIASVTMAVLFACLLAAVWIAQKRPQTKLNRDSFIVACSLAILWFPLRLYTEWYVRYYSLADLFAYPAFWLLAIVATISLIAVVAVMKPRKMSVVIPAIGAILSGIATAVGYIQPDALLAVTAIVEAFTLPLFAVLVVVLTTFLAVFAASVAQSSG